MPVDPKILVKLGEDGDWVTAARPEATHRFDHRLGRYVPLNAEGSEEINTPEDAARVTGNPLLAQLSGGSGGYGDGMDPEELSARIREMLVSDMIPMRQRALFSAISGLQRQANASPFAVMSAVAPQLGQLVEGADTAEQAIGQRLGPMVGGQGMRARGQINTQLAQQMAQLFAGVPGPARQGLYQIAQGTSQFLPSNPASTSTFTNTKEDPFDYSGLAQGITGIAALGRNVAPMFTQSPPALGYGTGPAPAFALPAGGYYP